MSNTLELVVQELQNRIGQITSNYETQLAVLKAQATEEISKRDAQIAELSGDKEDKWQPERSPQAKPWP